MMWRCVHSANSHIGWSRTEFSHRLKTQPFTGLHTRCQALGQVEVIGIDERQLFLHRLLGDEVQNFRHMAVLYNRHALDRVPAFDATAVHLLTASRTAEFPQAVQRGHGRGPHLVNLPLTLNPRSRRYLQVWEPLIFWWAKFKSATKCLSLEPTVWLPGWKQLLLL